jgi:sortase A
MAVAALSTIAAVVFIAKGTAIYAKAVLAQFLLEDAFAASLKAGEPVKPWVWADTWPVAKLEIPRLDASAIVLKGGSGEALAFGPGHLEGTPRPGEAGASVISAHRDTHFRFLRDIRLGDEIRVTRNDGAIFAFRISSTEIVPWDASGIDPLTNGHWLILSTCWPLDAATIGDMRYIVRAHLIGRQISPERQSAEHI